MWFLPLLVVGVIALASASRSAREPAPPSRQLPPPRPSGSPGIPGPISVLGEILRIGRTPPPPVILCAIAEAQAIGRGDLASDIVQAFVAPVVRRHERERARAARPAHACYERGSCASARSPSAIPSTSPSMPPAASPSAASTETAPVSAASAAAPAAPSQDEILAMLHSDPARFMTMATAASPRAQVVILSGQESEAAQATAEIVAQMQQQEAAMPEAADQTRAMAPGSPLGGVSDDAWRQFVVRLSRESPEFSSSRHVGQYRQRRERLAELGIDPAAIHGSAAAQRAALDADLADAYRHAAAGGLLDRLGRPIVVPGRDAPELLSLSVLLGVIQCAGLDGAVGWLERPNDRKRYPHTTQAFLQTNGMF